MSACIFRFRKQAGQKWERRSLIAEPRSAYLLDGPARTAWEHSIPAVEALRYSVTFRQPAEGHAPVGTPPARRCVNRPCSCSSQMGSEWADRFWYPCCCPLFSYTRVVTASHWAAARRMAPMCNDYGNHIPDSAYLEAFSHLKIQLFAPGGAPNLEPRDDIWPTDVAPIIRAHEDGGELVRLRWGFPPGRPKGPPVINMRSENRHFTLVSSRPSRKVMPLRR